MSTRELHRPDDDELLEALARAFVDEDLQPPPTGLAVLSDVLDAHFGPVTEPGQPDQERVVAPLPRRASRVAVAVAAGIIAVALGLGWYSWAARPSPGGRLSRIQDATASLRKDLAQHSPAPRTAQDVTSLAQLVAQVPAAQRPQVGTEPARLIAAACRQLLVGLPHGSAPPNACQTGVPAHGAASGPAANAAPNATDLEQSPGDHRDATGLPGSTPRPGGPSPVVPTGGPRPTSGGIAGTGAGATSGAWHGGAPTSPQDSGAPWSVTTSTTASTGVGTDRTPAPAGTSGDGPERVPPSGPRAGGTSAPAPVRVEQPTSTLAPRIR